MSHWLTLAVTFVVLVGGLLLLFFLLRRHLRHRLTRAADEFRILAQPLCIKFRETAAATGKPRGLRWKQCDYADEQLFAIHQKNGALYALVSVLISFEVVEGGPMEDATAAGDLRAATAVFIYRNGRWTTDGRVLFNLSPAQAMGQFGGELKTFELLV